MMLTKLVERVSADPNSPTLEGARPTRCTRGRRTTTSIIHSWLRSKLGLSNTPSDCFADLSIRFRDSVRQARIFEYSDSVCIVY